MPSLLIQLPNMPPVEHVLKDEALTVGRMKGNTISLDHSSVSLSHAKLSRNGTEYYLKDLNSTNGTLVNGQTVTEARLHDGDFVKFGDVTARYYSAYAPSTPQTVPSAPPATPEPVPAPVASQVSAPAIPAKAVPLPPPPAPVSPALQLAGKSSAAAPVAPTAAPLPEKKSPARSTTKKSARPEKPFLPLAIVAGGVLVAFLVWKIFFNHPTVAPVAKPPVVTAQPASVAPADAVQPAASQDLSVLIRGLKANDPTDRRRAAQALNAMGTGAREAVPAMLVALQDPDQQVRMWSALSLVRNKVYDKATVPILIQTLQQQDPILRQLACFSLALIPYEGAEKDPVVAALTDCLNKDDNSEVRNAAASALHAIQPDNGQK